MSTETTELRKCTTCKIRKPLDSFSSDKSRRYGKSYLCKDCAKVKSRKYHSIHKEKHNAAAGLWRKNNKSKLAEIHRYRTYGLTETQYESMLRKQGNACALCKKDFKETTPHVDHCHETGIVRGILCPGCNTGLGKFKDSPTELFRAALYLQRHNKS